ncbi:MAG: NADH-quinone oxidoreductase subunit C [Desulfobulbaceae bacterium]|nr:NADH-quinone oxidoreductase subunit C [Desulfobulbaceae bacterium]
MSIIYDTKWALLALFPEQAEEEKVREEEAKVLAALQEMEPAEEEGEKASQEVEQQEEAAAEKPKKPKEPEEIPPRNNGVLEVDYQARGASLDVLCSPEQVIDTAGILDKAGFFIESISGVDWIKEDQMEVIYDYSIVADVPCRVVVRTRIPRSEPVVPTISEIYPGANWHERETHEFFGIRFEGHPNLVPLLLPEDADFHPLRKDFKL